MDIKQEYKTECGYVDILIDDKTILEIAGNVHYLKDSLDLKIGLKRKLALIFGY